MFGLFKKKEFPLLTSEMLEPVDKDVTTQEAKSVFKQYLLQVNFCDKSEASDLVRDFAEELKDHLKMLKEDLADVKNELKDEKLNLKQLKAKLIKVASGEAAEDLNEEIEFSQDDILSLEKDIKNHQTEIDDFKKDKRAFLIENVNNYLRPNT